MEVVEREGVWLGGEMDGRVVQYDRAFYRSMSSAWASGLPKRRAGLAGLAEIDGFPSEPHRSFPTCG